MGLSVLQKWMVEGRGLGVSSTGVWTHTQEVIRTQEHAHTDRQVSRWARTREWEVMTVGVSVLVADPGANKLLTAAFTCRGHTGYDVRAFSFINDY